MCGAVMADRRIRDLRRLLEAVAEPYGATVAIERTTDGHLRSTFVAGPHSVFIITSFSPSDQRARWNVTADARRALKHMTGQLS
jgi:hypothetical protein